MKTKQQFKGQILTRTKVKNNILHFYNQSDKSDRYDWYGEANKFAQKLSDVVFRRTDLGTSGFPGDAAVNICADIMADEMGWDLEKKENEVTEVMRILPQFC